MKLISKLAYLFLIYSSFSALAVIPEGTYKATKIQCKSGKVMKLGGKFIIYDIFLDVKPNEMMMTAKAYSGDWAPFKLQCTQINKGTISYISEEKYSGSLPNTFVECNNPTWTKLLKKRLFGVENQGTFNYKVSGDELMIFNAATVTKYSCDQAGDYPIYYYKKI